MGWMWALLAIVVVLAVVGLLVARARDDGPDEAAEVREAGGRDVEPPQAPGLFDTATPVDPAAAAAGAHVPSPDAGPIGPGPAAGAGGEPEPDTGSAPEPVTESGTEREVSAGARSDAAARTARDVPAGTRPEAAAGTAGAAGEGPVDDAPSVPRPRAAEEPTTLVPEQAGAEAGEDEPGGRHALPDDVEPAPLPEPVLPEQAGPPEPLLPTRPARPAQPPATGGSALAALDSRLIGPAAASAPLPEGVRPGPYLGSVLAPEDGSEPPETHRVKVHSGSRRFHTTESPYYVRTRADLYFESESGARAAGFIAWHERPGAR